MDKTVKNINNAYSDKYKYLIKWNAKCGCTLIRRFFLYLHKDEKDCKENEWQTGLKTFRYNFEDKPQIINTFIVVRNPFKRVVSMFINKYMGPLNVDNLRHKFILPENSFLSFVLKLKELKEKNEWLDIHLIPQYYNYNDDDDIIIKLENIKNRLINLYSTIYRLNPLKRKTIEFFSKDIGFINETVKNNTTNFVGLTKYKDNYNGPWPDYKFFYNEDIKKLVYEIYKEDFIKFKYNYDCI